MDSRHQSNSPGSDAGQQITEPAPEENGPDWSINRRIDRWALRLIGGLLLIAALAVISYAASYHAAKVAMGSSPATQAQKPQETAVTVAMHDPGCHWFQVGQSFQKSLSVNGPVKLLNSDEAGLRVAMKGMKPIMIPVGQTADVPSGNYKVTMMGQAPDDNTLSLQVS